jgi:hypothetical protein
MILFPWLSSHALPEDPYIWPRVVEILYEVAKRITFEEHVIDVNINRLQEVVDKWLHSTAPVLKSVI